MFWLSPRQDRFPLLRELQCVRSRLRQPTPPADGLVKRRTVPATLSPKEELDAPRALYEPSADSRVTRNIPSLWIIWMSSPSARAEKPALSPGMDSSICFRVSM